MTAGDFSDKGGVELALLSDDGTVYILGSSSNIADRQMREAFAGRASRWLTGGRLLTSARVSTRPSDDLILVDSSRRRLHIITGEAAVENIQLIESCTLWAIAKETLTDLFNQQHDIERLVRIAYEKYYIRLEERYVNAQFKSAKERYEDLILQTPHILERVPLGFIASYLGISQETLSRIRSRF